MVTTTFSAAPTNATDAEFRDWGSKLAAAIVAVGFVKTADTGQINWTTVTRPTAAITYQGYEVYRFNDSLQGTYPLFMRIRFGSGDTAASPGITLGIGKSTDGAGNPLNAVGAVSIAGNTSTSTAGTWYVSSGDLSMLAICANVSGVTGGFSAGVERSRAVDGVTATGVGVITLGSWSGAGVAVRPGNYAAAVYNTTIPQWPAVIPANTATDVSIATGSAAPVFPAVMHDFYGNFWQPRSWFIGMKSDIGVGASFSVPTFGTYLGVGQAGAPFDSRAGAYATGAMLWQ